MSHALAWLAEPALAGFGEKHQMKTSSLYQSHFSFLFFAANCRKRQSYSRQASAGYSLKAAVISAWYCSISSARLGCVTRTTPT